MPAILRDHQDERFWLDRRVTNMDELLTVIAPYPEGNMYWYQVDKMVGNVNNDSEKCVKEIKMMQYSITLQSAMRLHITIQHIRLSTLGRINRRFTNWL